MWTFRRFAGRRRSPLDVYAHEGEGLRHATWLELFFDLVFVVAIAELGSFLHHDLTVIALVQFAGLFAIVWWIWLTISYFADTYTVEDSVSQVLVIAAMFGVIFLSQTIDGALRGGSFAFAAGVFALRLFLTVSHLRVRHLRHRANAFLTSWIGLEILVTIVWGMSLLVPEPGRYGLWIAAFVLGTVGITTIYLSFEEIIAPETSHCNERLGLFTILVLGETILSVGVGISDVTFDLRTIAIGALGFLIAVTTWWLYFERYEERVYERTLLARSRHWSKRRPRGIAHVYGHYLVHVGIVAAGVGIAVAIEAARDSHALADGARIAFCLGIAAFLLGSGVSQAMGARSFEGRTIAARASLIGLLVVAALFGAGISAFSLIALVAVSLLGLVVFEAIAPLAGTAATPTDV